MISSDIKLRIKTLICIIGMLFPLILIIFGGFDVNSLSEYYYTDAKWIFVSICMMMSFNMATVERWIIPGLLLMIIAFFPCKEFRVLHNASAIVFFLWSAVVMCISKRLSWIGYLMLISSITYAFNVYLCEIIHVMLISLFHLKYTYNFRKIKKLRN